MTRALLVAALLALAPGTARAETCREFRITGYASEVYGGTTADGTPTRGNEWRIAATDPDVIPLGTSVWVEGVGVVRAADTGPGVRGYHVDVLTRTVAEAYAITGWGLVCR